MNNVINKFLLAGDKFIPEMHLRQSQFVYSARGPFTRHKRELKNLNKQAILDFQHDSAYTDIKI